jgi:TonB-linked SusC/RagA family outer membrane protein
LVHHTCNLPFPSAISPHLPRAARCLATPYPRLSTTSSNRYLPVRSEDQMSSIRLTRVATALTVAMLASPPLAHAQTGVVSGVVVVEGSQRPLPGAQVSVQNDPSRGVISDASGRFRLPGLSGTTVVLSARMLGYRPALQTVSVGASNVRFSLSERPLELDAVVVTGTAGGEQKRALGTSVASINVADVQNQTAVPTMEGLLVGRAPGVDVLPGTGMIGGGAIVRIRGIGSFSLSSDPLIYVDGVRVNNQTGTGISVQAFSSGVVSRLNDFNPDEIENIEVLKGPAAATLYGTEAARGVINIITKKGAAGGTKYVFQARGGANWFQNAEGRIPTNYCYALTNPNCRMSPTDTQMYSINVVTQENARGTPIFRTGGIHEYSGNVSGGANQLRFFASGESNINQGAEPNNERRQTSARTNLTITPNEKVDVQTNFGYVSSHTTLSCEGGCGGAMWESMYSNPQNLPQFCAPSDFGCNIVRGFQSAPPESDRAQQDWQDLNRLTASATITYNPFKWMSNRVSLGTDYNREGNIEYVPYLTNDTLAYFWGAYANGYRFNNQHQAIYNTYDYNGSAHFDVTPNWGSKSSVGVQYYTREDSYIQGEGDFFPAPGLQTILAAGQQTGLQDGWSGNNTFGYYGQQEFSWAQRLYLTGALRVDNNSAFGNQVHWVTYPKASISYVASDEPSIKAHMPSFMNSLRVRAAYGGSGQQPAALSALQTLTSVTGTAGKGALTPGQLGNADLKPERVLGTEAGFETSLFSDRVGVDFTFFHDVSNDAILSRQIAPSTGFGGTQFFNAGQIVKKGIELGIKTQIISHQNYGWDLNLNVATNSGKITRLNGTDTTIDLGSYSHRVGYAPFDWFSYKVLSATYDPVARKAINPMCDNGVGQPMPCYSSTGAIIAPKIFLGHSLPTLTGSLTNTIRFAKYFRVYGMIDYANGYKRLDNNIRIRCQIFHTCLEYLLPQNTDPARLVQMQSNGTLRDFVFSDAGFAKLREVSLSVDAPQYIAAKAGAHDVAIVFSGRNLHTWTSYTGLDPESRFVSNNGPGIDQAELPQLTQFVVTVRFGY